MGLTLTRNTHEAVPFGRRGEGRTPKTPHRALRRGTGARGGLRRLQATGAGNERGRTRTERGPNAEPRRSARVRLALAPLSLPLSPLFSVSPLSLSVASLSPLASTSRPPRALCLDQPLSSAQSVRALHRARLPCLCLLSSAPSVRLRSVFCTARHSTLQQNYAASRLALSLGGYETQRRPSFLRERRRAAVAAGHHAGAHRGAPQGGCVWAVAPVALV